MRDAFPGRLSLEPRGVPRALSLQPDAVVQSHAHPLPGSDGLVVATDVASFGRREARRVLIVVSGTHGVEGLCGAGVQLGLLDRSLPGVLDDDVRLVLVHALNPHGFLGLHRTNEDNVDLNRNFVAHDGALSGRQRLMPKCTRCSCPRTGTAPRERPRTRHSNATSRNAVAARCRPR